MNKTIKYILAIIVVLAAATYFFFSFKFTQSREKGLLCKKINVNIENREKNELVGKQEIEQILNISGEKIIGENINQINIFRLKNILAENSSIKSSEIYTTIDGKLNVNVEQRHPIMLIDCDNAKFYIDDTGYMLPISTCSKPNIPIVTGFMKADSCQKFIGAIGKKNKLLMNLYNFATFMSKNKFWDDMITQINIEEDKIELITQISEHTIVLKTLDNIEEKLKKLQVFYQNAMPAIGWNTYKTINIEYKNQIICKK